MKLPLPSEKFVCLDPYRQDLSGKPLDNIHIEVYGSENGIDFFCYGDLSRHCSNFCFGHSKTLEGAAEIINHMQPYVEPVEDPQCNLQE